MANIRHIPVVRLEFTYTSVGTTFEEARENLKHGPDGYVYTRMQAGKSQSQIVWRGLNIEHALEYLVLPQDIGPWALIYQPKFSSPNPLMQQTRALPSNLVRSMQRLCEYLKPDAIAQLQVALEDIEEPNLAAAVEKQGIANCGATEYEGYLITARLHLKAFPVPKHPFG